MDGELHRNVEAVQNVASKHQCVLRSVDSMDPTLITNTHNEVREHEEDSCKLTELNGLYDIQAELGIVVYWSRS